VCVSVRVCEGGQGERAHSSVGACLQYLSCVETLPYDGLITYARKSMIHVPIHTSTQHAHARTIKYVHGCHFLRGALESESAESAVEADW